MESFNNSFNEYLTSLIGQSVERECDAVNIANAICDLTTSLNRPSFVESTKKQWHEWQEQPMLEHYGVTDKVKEYTHE